MVVRHSNTRTKQTNETTILSITAFVKNNYLKIALQS